MSIGFSAEAVTWRISPRSGASTSSRLGTPPIAWRRGARTASGVGFVEKRAQVERDADHRDAVTVSRPLLARPVAVELDAVAVEVAQVDRLADAVIARALDRHAGLEHAAQRHGERLAVGVA